MGPSLCITDQETQEESLLGGTNPFTGQSLHPSPVQSPRSIHSWRQSRFRNKFLFCTIFCGTKSMLHRSRNSGRDFWWNQLPCEAVLTPISCTKLKIHSAHEDSPGSNTSSYFSPVFYGTKSGPHRSRNSWRDFAGWNQPFYRSVLLPKISLVLCSTDPFNT